MKTRAWWVYLLVMAPVVGLYSLGPDALNAGPVFNAIGVSAVAAILVGIRLHQPKAKRAWYLIAFGMALFISGDVLAYNYERVVGRPLPFPSIADPLYLAVFPAIVAGLLLLIRARNRGGDRSSLIDSLIIGTAIGLLSWMFLMAPYAHDVHLSGLQKLTSLSYPLADLFLLSVAIRLAVAGGAKSRSYYLTVLSIGVLFATDAAYGWEQLHGLLPAGRRSETRLARVLPPPGRRGAAPLDDCRTRSRCADENHPSTPRRACPRDVRRPGDRPVRAVEDERQMGDRRLGDRPLHARLAPNGRLGAET